MKMDPKAVLVLAGRGEKKESPSEDEEKSDAKEKAFEIMAKKIQDAKDDKEFAAALKSFVKMCLMDKDYDTKEEEE